MTAVAQQTAPGSSLPDPMEPEAFTQVTFHLLTSNISVIGNYSVKMHYNPVPGDIPNILAVMIYNKSSDEFGWDFVQVTANEELVNSNEDKGFRAYYAAGYLEAYIAAKRIAQIYISQGLTTPQPQAVLDWVERHIAYMNSKATENMRAGYPNPFWTQVGNLLAQIEGMAAGYNVSLVERGLIGPSQPNLTFTDFFLLNFNNELSEVYNLLNVSSSDMAATSTKQRTTRSQSSPDKLLPFKNRNLHCSALVKVTDEDIFFSHDSWNSYSSMMRQYKVYKFQTTVSMSGAAGTIASGDDWYITSNNLAVQETTNDFYNASLLEYVVPESVSEFLRAMVATFLANNGREWVELFQFNNSGTYCNQWMVLDYKMYTPGAVGDALPDNLLWVAEQIPGNVTSADVTQTLRETSYWASYNIPYSPVSLLVPG
ncbi:phospholipase B-like protein, putative [Bodo saltans]|uniref:Phospholipase B-like n=1 Tax=Bodo saltans TaxID=75058 RepID=A0A0S4ITQ3_BODSA|nr:phospholipase B-like protein, putative [Bodo saltans]|eukprot:CUG06690.1 phospholipase B-like protein, putative [Bodo saltans]